MFEEGAETSKQLMEGRIRAAREQRGARPRRVFVGEAALGDLAADGVEEGLVRLFESTWTALRIKPMATWERHKGVEDLPGRH